MPTIYVTPDLFYHRWDEDDGELWLALRPFVLATGAQEHRGGDLSDFDAWAKAPHDGSAFAYADQLPGMAAACRLPENLRMIPVMLPTDLDVWVQIIRGAQDPAPWTRISRSQGCQTSPDVLTNDLGDLFGGGEAGGPPLAKKSFAYWFNQQVTERYVASAPADRDRLAQWLELRLESGDLVDWTCGQEITDLFRDEADPARPPLPIFRPDGPAYVACPPAGDEIETNLYWLSGLMTRLGKKPSKDFINEITGVNIHLVANTSDDPQNAKLKIQVPPLDVGQAPQPAYFAAVKDKVDVRLTAYVANPCDPAMLSPKESQLSQACGVAYVSPVFRGMASSEDAPDAWVFSAERLRTADASDRAAPLRDAPPLLKDLAGIEVRADAPEGSPAPPQTLDLWPGFVIAGRVRPYRRFPSLSGPGPRRETVMVFEPGAGDAARLDAIQRSLGVEVVAKMFEHADVRADWRLELLDSKPLPWDGPNPVYRVLAKPGKTPAVLADAGAGETRTMAGAAVVLRLAGPKPLVTTAKDRIDPEEKQDRWLWRPPAAVDAKGLHAFWTNHSGKWADLPCNAVFPATAGGAAPELGRPPTPAGLPAGAGLDCLYLGDYSFQLADDRLRMERILVFGTEGNGADGADAACTTLVQPPAEDYEDDLVNFNGARILDKAGERIDDRIRFAQGRLANSAKGRLYRRQFVPLVLEWEREPANARPKPGEEPPARGDLSWKDLRRFVRGAFLDDLPVEPFGVRLEHTYGAGFLARDEETDAAISLSRSKRRGWAVDTPTAAETFEDKTGPAASGSARFISCTYADGNLSLQLDPGVLDPAVLRSRLPNLSKEDAYALALAAWRAAAEVASAASVGVELQLRSFDVGRIVGPTPADAARLARAGATGRWSEAIDARTWRLALSAEARKNLVGWLERALAEEDIPVAPRPVAIPVSGPGGKPLETSAHVARAHLLIQRHADHGPPPELALKPITRQPGLHEISPKSLYSVWAQMGFGPFGDRKTDAPLQELDPRVEPARDRWLATLTAEDDSITPTPEVLPKEPLTDEQRQARDVRAAELRQAAALIAELEGTDWFTPKGRPEGPGYDITPVILPLGFSALAPHPKLDRAAQTIVQRVLAMVRDAVDLSYKEWAESENDWKGLFRQIAALATWTPETPEAPRLGEGRWTGPLPELLQTLVDVLLRPQPDARSSTVAQDVVDLANAFDDNATQVAALRSAVLRKLHEDPALFADAKAFLLTQLKFGPSATVKTSPPPQTLARARFTRHVRPAGDGPQAPPDRAISVLGWEGMVGVGSSNASEITARLAFLDVLDDAGYDNAFHVGAADCVFEPFEEMVDPPQPGEIRLRWGSGVPVAPSHAETKLDPKLPREVRLASRNLASPPLYKMSLPDPEAPSGLSLRKALAALEPGQPGWRYDRLIECLPPLSTAGPANALDMSLAAFRKRDAEWDTPLPADVRMVYFCYEVVGDEEAAGVDIADAFANDGFFVRLSRTPFDPPPEADPAHVKPADFSPLSDGVEEQLRGALTPARGTREAAEYVQKSILGAPEVLPAVKALIQSYRAPAVPAEAVLMKPRGGTTATGDFCVGSGPSAARIRDVALFRKQGDPAKGAPKDATALLVFGLALDVWTDWHVELIHGRNLPFSQWGANCDAPGRTPASFAPQFWQMVPQTAEPVVHRLQNTAANDPGGWRTDRRVFELPAQWVEKDIPVSQLVEQLLYEEKLLIGDLERGNVSILDPANKAMIYGHRLSVTVCQERFEGLEPSPLNQRFAFPSVECADKAAADAKTVRFTDEYGTLSVDLHWFREAGAAPLLLQRIFIRAP